MKKQVLFQRRFAEALRMRGLKQIELAKKTGIGRSAINQYLSGRFEPKRETLYIIAKALNVSEAWLMGFDVPMERKERNPNATIDRETVIGYVDEFFGDTISSILVVSSKLNSNGQAKLFERCQELLQLIQYVETENQIGKSGEQWQKTA